MSSVILITKHTAKPVYQSNDSVPEVSLALPKHEVNPTSKSPPMIKRIQLIKFQLKKVKVVKIENVQKRNRNFVT